MELLFDKNLFVLCVWVKLWEENVMDEVVEGGVDSSGWV